MAISLRRDVALCAELESRADVVFTLHFGGRRRVTAERDGYFVLLTGPSPVSSLDGPVATVFCLSLLAADAGQSGGLGIGNPTGFTIYWNGSPRPVQSWRGDVQHVVIDSPTHKVGDSRS
ncbi:MAG: hypothetical protein H6822_26625 [Planctomycetaceae bacterium]|nr:hypothetical protein [Planctomycetales bacterium]MCB9925754.1 hypothetical protein [Planctomycetaceae bacterium]